MLQQQQQQRQQFSPRFPGAGQNQPPFTQMGDPLSGGQGIPENFGELMNTSMAPNVTLQVNGRKYMNKMNYMYF